MATRLTESASYAHLWSTPALVGVFDDQHRLQTWLDILAALAAAQAELGLVPAVAAEQIAEHARVERLDLEFVAAETRHTSHSTLGLIRGLQQVLPEPAREYVYYGATVQDLTDTWSGLVMRDVGRLVRADLARAHARMLRLAAAHRDTVMVGRTHGQPGAPITFGFKAATWADEIGRHIVRLDEGDARWSVGQLAGAVGVLGFFEPDGQELRRRFCARLGLRDPGISWTATRDRVAEFGSVLSMIAGTLARVGNEVYELQRPEIGELSEAPRGSTVGSITMPHKRNPEASEHLDTLARIARAAAGVLVEGMVSGHERDGRAWKAEWMALPEVALTAGTAASLAGDLLDGLVVDEARMRANLDRTGQRWASERVLAELSRRLGKHRAQELMQEALSTADGADLVALLASRGVADPADLAAWVESPAIGTAGAMVDAVVARGTPGTTV
ncbi:adenylosuccinate lyase family protein [Planosporangium flavigriseum]|uniref:Adenylosuccinate lyase n=1 Tax=Planosporangium flavigriseum TaxID=373681 RepID=A0A8J3LJT0_9ACTN|nr:adenylosuccinate lyase family protein [Planosporangium flavigriseum]NJC63041.1 adenylosuccinate lyase family protein [Planosporangium flavigriseum]GIG73087.1 adenylosuccinate lyase [Planosporangium flavigriseum]